MARVIRNNCYLDLVWLDFMEFFFARFWTLDMFIEMVVRNVGSVLKSHIWCNQNLRNAKEEFHKNCFFICPILEPFCICVLNWVEKWEATSWLKLRKAVKAVFDSEIRFFRREKRTQEWFKNKILWISSPKVYFDSFTGFWI